MATHSSILAWKIPWTEEPGGLQSMGSHRVCHDWVIEHQAYIHSVISQILCFRFLFCLSCLYQSLWFFSPDKSWLSPECSSEHLDGWFHPSLLESVLGECVKNHLGNVFVFFVFFKAFCILGSQGSDFVCLRLRMVEDVYKPPWMMNVNNRWKLLF